MTNSRRITRQLVVLGLPALLVWSSACKNSDNSPADGSSSDASDSSANQTTGSNVSGEGSGSASNDKSDATTGGSSASDGGSDKSDSTGASDSGDTTPSGDDTQSGGSDSGIGSDSTADSSTSSDDTGSDTGVDPASPFGINGKLHICDGMLCNEHGHPIQLRGMSSHGLQWFENCIKPSAFKTLRHDWGADVVRLSMYIQEEGYENDPVYFRAMLDRMIEQCSDEGLYCILDWHQHEPGDPNFNLELAKEFFDIMAEKHADKDNVIFEICNEPSGVEWSEIKSYGQEVIPVVRKHAPDSVIIVGTPHWASEPSAVIGDELDFDNLMYTMHFYADEHQQDYRDQVMEAAEAGIAVFATEFGTQWSSGDGDNNFESAQEWLDLLEHYKISWTNWNFSDDKRSGAVWERIRDSEDESDPDKSGDVCKKEMWTDDHLKEAGKWIKDHMLSPADDFPTD